MSSVLTRLPDFVRGTVTLSSTLYTTAILTYLDISYRAAGSSTWTTLCTGWFSTSQSCALDTVRLLSDGPYEIRTHGWTLYAGDSYDYQTVTVDNTSPTNVTITAPTGVLGGTIALAGTAQDATSGVASVTFQYRRAGVAAWTDCGTDTSTQYSCDLDTGGFTNGVSYDFRAVATDAAGNTTTSMVSRTVNNTPATVSITSPAEDAVVDKAVSVDVSAVSARGVTQVKIQTRPADGTFTDLCTDTTSPYSCSWDATALPAGTYEVRAVLSQTSGGDVVSATRTVGVDHSPGTLTIASPSTGSTTISHQNSVTVTGSTARSS